jgi:hypothetical protein
MIRAMLIFAAMLLLGACGHTGATRVEYRTVNVAVAAQCPDDATFAAVRDARPVPLRDQQKPDTAAAQYAAERAQLARYEARGAFADQAMAVIESCNARKPLAPP